MILSPGSNSLYAYCALSWGKMCTDRSMVWSVIINVLLLSADAQESNGPVIVIPNENETILQSGQNYTLLCRGKMPVRFEQQELPEENVGGFYKESRFSETDSEYLVELDLFNVDRFAVGYYACFYDTADSTNILKNIIEEPKNSEDVAYTYIYVNDSTLVAPVRAFARVQVGSKYLIECKPTTPDINVTLIVPQSNNPAKKVKYNPKIGFIFSNIPRKANKGYLCRLQRGTENSTISMPSSARSNLPSPTIDGGDHRFLAGETFTINCTVQKPDGVAIDLQWIYPDTADDSKIEPSSNSNHTLSGNAILYQNITIKNASENESGSYYCLCNNNMTSNFFVKEYLENAVLIVTARKQNTNYAINKGATMVRLIGDIVDAYPEPTVTMFRDETLITIDNKKYTYRIQPDKCFFTIHNKSYSDTATYYMKFFNGYLEKIVPFVVNIIGPPKIDTLSSTAKRCIKGVRCSFKCEALGLPFPNYKWKFTDENGSVTTLENSREVKIENSLVNGLKYKTYSRIEIPVNLSGNLTCNASNTEGTDTAVQTILVNEIDGGFGILNPGNTWFSEGNSVNLTCLVSLYDFINVTWLDENGDEVPGVQLSQNELSIIARVTMDPITVENEGSYSCVAKRFNDSEEHQDITITVAGKRPLKFLGPESESQTVNLIDKVNMTCVADAVPPPAVEWYKDGSPVEFDNDKIVNDITFANRTTIISTINIYPMHSEFAGVYECKNKNGEQRKSYTLILNDGTRYKNTIYISVFSILSLFLILMIVYLIWKIRKETQFKRELAAAGLLNFKKGHTASINPDLGIDEQAELLPYDERFEFPAERLSIGKQLGAGAFGVVYKAEARGIINAEETTTVAVKTVKKTADNMYIKALASELKIMVHLGKHINIVNLLGACTKKVGKRELIVIVEYCKFGNIHNYLQKHREVFIDQLNDNTEKSLGKVNRAYSSSSGNTASRMSSSDYFGSNHTQDTDNTVLNTTNSNRSGRKVSEAGYVQPEWRSNYECDYSYDGRCPRPLCSRDLLAWSFQVARGMEYLASKKILHGDLAARNILLAEDNVVKICDFGLARSIYKNDEYQKKGNSPLPVKWLAIECVTDQIFSTQSDVWSFGIVLWEIFSLAKTPYPNLSPASLLPRLVNGYRLEKPAYANDKLYDVMRQCWHQKPTSRPSFTQLQEILGSFLEDNVRNHYVDLNATYMDMNKKQDGEDYLAMVSAPDYNNLLTPSPHEYANDAMRFFPATPTQLQHDDEGYLQVSPASQQTLFNARQGTKFVSDGRTPRASDANSYGSESTPMLIFNGSDSDHENVSPYMNMCTKIIEEPDDEVFKTKENNAKNIQPVIGSVDNPSYITPGDIQKQQNFTNNYTNITKPNGLVK